MHPVISIGKQNFASLRENNCFYIDKSDLIRKWWKSQDARIMLQNMAKKCRKMLQKQVENTEKSNETH